MTSAVWPDSLPALASSSVRVSRPDVRTALEMDNGSIRRIRRSLSAPWHVDGEIWLTPPQQAVFDHFYRFELRDGLWWFTAPWLDGLGLTGMAARFREPPRLTRASATLWKAAVRFEAIDAAQAIDSQDWPISNVVSVTGIPTDHIAFWLKPDSYPYAPGASLPSIPDYSGNSPDAPIHGAIYAANYQGFPSIEIQMMQAVSGWSLAVAPYAIYLPWPSAADLTVAVVYGVWNYPGGTGPAVPIDSIGALLATGRSYARRTLTQMASAAGSEYGALFLYDTVRINNGSGFTPHQSKSSVLPVLRVAALRLPVRRSYCSSMFNGMPVSTNVAPVPGVRGPVGFPLELTVNVPSHNYVYHVGSFHILEAVLWRRTLTDTEISAVTNHFIDKYAIPL